MSGQKKKKPAVKKRQPQRTCVVCRQKFDKRRLTRLVRVAAEESAPFLAVDLSGKRNGRGAYICDSPACWQRAIRQPNLLSAALKMELSAADKATVAAAAPAVKIEK